MGKVDCNFKQEEVDYIIYIFLYHIKCLLAIGSMLIPQAGKDLLIYQLGSLIKSKCLEWCLTYNRHSIAYCT